MLAAHSCLRFLRSSWRREKKRSQAARKRFQTASLGLRGPGPISFQSARVSARAQTSCLRRRFSASTAARAAKWASMRSLMGARAAW